MEKSGKAVTASEIVKAGKDSSKQRKKNPAPSAEVNVEGVGVIPLVVLLTPVDATTDVTQT